MAKYAPFGQAVFNQTVFGVPPTVNYVTFPRVVPTGYDSLTVSWFPLTSLNVLEQVLVRSSFGVPTQIGDGTTVLDQKAILNLDGSIKNRQFDSQFIDSGQMMPGASRGKGLRSGHFYYYSLFAWDKNLQEYFLTGACQGLVLTDWDFGDKYLTWLPNYYSMLDSGLTSNVQPAGPLERLMDLLGYEMDWMRSEIESFFMFTSGDWISGALLPFLGGNYDMPYEPTLGMTRSRYLIRHAVRLYKQRGTLPGIQAAASAYSGYGCLATIGANLLLQLDDAAFDLAGAGIGPGPVPVTVPPIPIGHWTPTNAQSTVNYRSVASLAATPPPVPHLGYQPISGFPSSTGPPYSLLKGYLPQSNVNVGVISSNGALFNMTTCNAGLAPTLGIPIATIPATSMAPATQPTYVFSFYVLPLATTPMYHFVAQLDWYGPNGAFLSSTSGPSTAEAVGTWTRISVAAQPPSPTLFLASTVGVTIRSTTDLVASQHFIDACKLEVNSQATPGPSAWDPPRDIKINLLPKRQNLVANPQAFSVPPTEFWSSTGMTSFGAFAGATPTFPVLGVRQGFQMTIAAGFRSSYSAFGTLPFGGGVASGTSGAPGNQSISTTAVAYPEEPYTFSAWVMKSVGVGNANIVIQFLDGNGLPILNNGVPYIFSTPFPLNAGQWNQGFVTGTAPDGTGGIVATIQIVQGAAGDVYYVSAPLLEPGGSLRPYFDGNFSPSPDYFWEGIPFSSTSDYYPNLETQLMRLVDVMPDYIPMGSTFSIYAGAQVFVNLAFELAHPLWGSGLWSGSVWGGGG